jgi:hypothetical protein
MKENAFFFSSTPPQEEKPADPYAAIRSMEQIVDIEQRDHLFHVQPPEALDFSVFGSTRTEVEEAYRKLYVWLRLPFVHDVFNSPKERNAWRETLEIGKRRAVEQNKFRTNPASVATGFFHFLPEDAAEAAPDFKEKLGNLIDSDPSPSFFCCAIKAIKDCSRTKAGHGAS